MGNIKHLILTELQIMPVFLYNINMKHRNRLEFYGKHGSLKCDQLQNILESSFLRLNLSFLLGFDF
jgi:hypothetical protein